jgi:HSP90 family molecular chaperone
LSEQYTLHNTTEYLSGQQSVFISWPVAISKTQQTSDEAKNKNMQHLEQLQSAEKMWHCSMLTYISEMFRWAYGVEGPLGSTKKKT